MSILSLIKRAPKRFTAVVAMVAAAIIVPATLFAWGPNRETYTIAHPADHVVFNSITDNPAVGDERNFMRVRDTSVAGSTYGDSVSLTPGKEYTVFVYYHNNAASNLNASGVGIATGAYAKTQIPAVIAKGTSGTKAAAYIGAANAAPKEVYDDISFTNTTNADIALRYVHGSAQIFNGGATNGKTLSDNIITTGATLGYNALDGKLPGCNEYSGYVTFRVKADQPNFTLNKLVRVAGTSEWKESVQATPGATVEYQLQYKNTGTTEQKNVSLKDTLPKNISYVPNSSYLMNTSYPSGKLVSDNLFSTNGLNVGHYLPGGAAYVKFSAKVAAKESLDCGKNTLRNVVRVITTNGWKEDTADVTVDKECKDITVCELATKKIITIKETAFDATKHSKNLKDCEEKDITVCELATKKIVTIKENQFDSKKHSKNLKDCETLETLVVCELATKKIVTINKNDFDAKKHSNNLEDCKQPVHIIVCELATKKSITIDEATFDATKHSKDFTQCTTTPPELPKTGMGENIVAIVGLGAMIASIGYYIASRRALNQ